MSYGAGRRDERGESAERDVLALMPRRSHCIVELGLYALRSTVIG